MEISHLCQMLFIYIKTSSVNPVVRLVLCLYFLIQPLSLILIRKLRKRLRHGNVCWTATMAILVPVYIISSLYCMSQVQGAVEKIFPTERAGIVVVTTLLRILSALSLLEHPSNIQEMPHLIVYGFGAAVPCVVNAMALMGELIFKARHGKRSMMSDLRLVILPFECFFVSGWFFLLLYNYWACSRGRGGACSEIQNGGHVQQDIPAAEEMDTLSPC
ncbi:uncharacterized protein LOC116220720 [Clupea harengus]|uniref:Uncharacterized protein LOC116220720 n=1 Tax=Clupea harengus TaxID=7950 RepID=A0A8M1KMR2_CLUHA|nr:uncharacterized protein LOC116220720 [Clupea harengus]